jgi:hypothetical protein
VRSIDPQIHSMVIASDYRVPNPERVWPLLQRRKSALAGIGAHHVLVYTSTHDYGRVLVTIGVRSREPIVELLRSRVFFDWFDAVGVEDIPAVFAGEIVERFETSPPSDPTAPGVVVAAIASVDDVSVLAQEVRAGLTRFAAAGVRKTWIFQAFDDGHEVMILQHLDDEGCARRWIDRPDIAAPWIARAGVGAYPPVFVGKFVDMMRIDG